MKLVSFNCDRCCCHQDSSRSVGIFFYCFFHCRFHAYNRQWKLTSVFFCGHTRSCIAGDHNRIYLLLYHKCYNFVNISPDLLSCFFPIWDMLLVRIIEKICFWYHAKCTVQNRQPSHARVKNTYFHDVTPRTMNVPWHIQVVLSL